MNHKILPTLSTSAARVPAVPFAGHYLIKRGFNSYALMKGTAVVATYDGDNLIVHPAFDDQPTITAFTQDFDTNHQSNDDRITEMIREGIQQIIREEIEGASYEDDIKRFVALINGIINNEKYKSKHRFDYTNNKKIIQKQLEQQILIYDYDSSVDKELLKAITSFLFALESEREMPQRFVDKNVEYFDCKLSQHWNDLKNHLVQALTSNVESGDINIAPDDDQSKNVIVDGNVE